MSLFKRIFKKTKPKVLIGRLEKIDIPRLGLKDVLAKIDTGAYRGALHAQNIKEITKKGKKYLSFSVLDDEHPYYENKIYRFKEYKIVKVRTSQTDFEKRYAINLKINIAGTELVAQLSLTNRKDMRQPILIGRRALKKRFLVDVNKLPNE